MGGLRENGLVGGIYINDFNLCNKTGYYRIVDGSKAVNNPNIAYGGMISINTIEADYFIQIAFDMFNKKIAYRMTQSGGSWTEWYSFT